MLLRTMIRSSAATVLLPLLVAFVLLALSNDLSAWVTPRYWPSATGSAAFAQPFVSAACAAAAAWEGARLTKGRVFDQTSVRGPVAIAVPVLLPVLLMGVIGILVALVITAAAADVPLGLPEAGILAAIIAMLAANTLVGFIVGRVLPGVLAAPVALVGSFFATAYPASWNVMWLRYLVGGGLSNCCSVDTSIDARALAATLTFAAAVSCAALLLIHRRGGTATLCMVFVLLSASVGISWSLTRDLGAEPLQPRDTAALICDDGARPAVCLWPEVEDPETVRKASRAAAARLEQAGVQIPPTLTMAARPGPQTLKLGIGPTTSEEGDIAGGVASGLLPEPPPCAFAGAPYPAAVAAGPLSAWLYTTAGMPADSVAGRFGPEDAAMAQQLTKLPASQQIAWYKKNREALGKCSTPPPLRIAQVTR
ncbi:hypothetical protein ACFCXK_34090 [Streptomyces sp. NPDC056269]|uniref:DUF7224 domain-containing protein n=1 Tax=Streptomyces sp. NPDC056269 TaxID=3345768 RepID=UPI0035E2E76C